VVIELSDRERTGEPAREESESFEAYTGSPAGQLSRDQVCALLLESGLWTALRTRPFGNVADPATPPHSLFVTAMDTQPLAADVNVVLAPRQADFAEGLTAIAKLTDGKTYVCTHPDTPIPAPAGCGTIQVEHFTGVHPAGTPGLHIHLLDPVNRNKTVWYINYQDVLAIGKLFATGRLDVERVVSLAGPAVRDPRLLRTRIGASLDELTAEEITNPESRVISGSVLSGRTAAGETLGYLGRYHLQVSVLAEGRSRAFLGWTRPGVGRFSIIPAYVGKWLGGRYREFTTTTNGDCRAIVPIGLYERVMPLDIEPVFLLKALVMRDIERAELLGALELEEEDLALCSFVCPGKTDYAPILRDNLNILQREG
jgi:Na+-transporting NADH:ubiquinone oxidoreductase subunit A